MRLLPPRDLTNAKPDHLPPGTRGLTLDDAGTFAVVHSLDAYVPRDQRLPFLKEACTPTGVCAWYARLDNQRRTTQQEKP